MRGEGVTESTCYASHSLCASHNIVGDAQNMLCVTKGEGWPRPYYMSRFSQFRTITIGVGGGRVREARAGKIQLFWTLNDEILLLLH